MNAKIKNYENENFLNKKIEFLSKKKEI